MDPSYQITFEREKKKYPIYEDADSEDYDRFVPTTYTSSIPQNQLFQRQRPNKYLSNEAKNCIKEMESALTVSRRTRNSKYVHQLHRAREICIHNGKAALTFRQHRKADVWNLLAEIIDNVASGVGDEFDGWKGFGNGSLGRNLLKEILSSFEREGDVQMLATIVSVIGSGRNRSGWGNTFQDDIDLLLPSDIKRFDIYIHLYANMLFSWGRIEISAELKKHLNSSCNDMVESGLTFAPTCLVCERALSPHEIHSKTCKNCNSYAFKCSICTNSVRGLFTVCFICSHGGHFDHIHQWFSERNYCPTGCGCTCIFMNTSVSGQAIETSLLTQAQEA